MSLFEPDIHVIVRGKAGAEVEFGNLLILREQEDGLIIDRELFKEEVPADTRLVRPAVELAERGLAAPIKCLVTDRGFDNKTNVKWLEGRGTFAGLCPRDPRALRAAMKDEHFARAQRAEHRPKRGWGSSKINFWVDQCARRDSRTALYKSLGVC